MKKIVYSALFLLVCLVGLGQMGVLANKYILKDGRIIEGDSVNLSRVDEKPNAQDFQVRPIIVIDDGLRHTYLRTFQIRQPIPEPVVRPEPFKTGQRANKDGQTYYIPGTYTNSVPFDEFGRRLLPVRHSGGVEYVEQAIVELNPYYITVTSIQANLKPVVWNMRIATNGRPRKEITPILMRLIDSKNVDDRIKLARFYYAGKLYLQADAELESIALDWKDSPDVLQQIRSLSMRVRQDLFQQKIDELEFRWESGQYQFVRKHIEELAHDPRLPERLLEPVRQMVRRYEDTEQLCQEITETFKELYEALPESDKNEKIPPILAEIEKELNQSTLRRLDAFQLYADDTKLSAAEKLAIGITGWYAGAEAENTRLAIAITLPETEKLITDYLRSGPDYLLRQRILEQLKNLETSRPDLIAGILATMKPPFSDLPDEDPEFPGYYQFTIPSPLFTAGAPMMNRAAEIRYTVQLPPDYNPHQRYPVVVSLHGQYQTPDAQIDWWAGPWRNGMRAGHATRHGYIVIAPEWNPPEARLSDYDFSVFSHTAVLHAVKDAFRRFSVNTDKVFISGHGSGGTAAWDIALAHPDLWAGTIPFNAVASKYIDTYESAARYVPLYLVWGEMEGDGLGNARKWAVNALVMNRYLQAPQKNPVDATAIRYIGRGLEGFSEEILHILEWMKVRQRSGVPFDFTAETMRPWDSFFWWVEMPVLHTDVPGNMCDPIDFPANRNNARPLKVESKLYRATNTVVVTTGSKVVNTIVSLTPDMVDFNARVTVKVNDKPYHPANGVIVPNIETMLEDVRTRCDRLHPFWVMLTGK